MDRVLIPGKNWKLSLAELFSFLEARKITFKTREFSKEFFAIQIDEKVNHVDVSNLGGIIKIGAIDKTIPTDQFEKAFVQKDKEAKNWIRREIASSNFLSETREKASGKFLFGISVYCSVQKLQPLSSGVQRFAGSSIKTELAHHKIRSEFMGFPRAREQPQLTHVEVLKKKLVENKAEVLLCVGKLQTWFAITSSVHNPFDFQKRDIGKPNQRKIFAIPPRLARIMVNLAECRPGKILLDPFCGVGTILQEALLSNAQVVGVDANRWCVEAAVENLEWLSGEYALAHPEFRVLKGDALKLKSMLGTDVDCIVTEPDLGPALRDIPTSAYAEKIADKLTPLYFAFIQEAFNILNKEGRLVLVTPYLRTRSGKPVTMHIEEKAQEAGFTIIYPFGNSEFFEVYGNVKENMRRIRRFVDIAERHKTGREIHVFQK